MSSSNTPGDRSRDAADPQGAGDHEAPRISDKRRIDPTTGKVRDGGASASASASSPSSASSSSTSSDDAAADLLDAELTDLEVGLTSDLVALQKDLAERTSDLQRLHAEYANYRKRVERDREGVRDQAASSVLAELLPVLDDIGRARQHDELEGAFKAVGESLESVVTKLGLETYGVVGDPFDPMIHEALTHEHSSDVKEATCVGIFQPGYRFRDRVVRPARVAVAEPE